MKQLTTLARPFIVCVLTDRTVDAAIATMRLALYEGADAYEVNLPALGAAGAQALRRLFSAVDRPIYTSCRRAGFMTVYGFERRELPAWSDEERMQQQLDALSLGSVAIDMEMDTFDPHPAPPLGTPDAEGCGRASGEPAELTRDPAALERQRAIIADAHAAGGEVILSCHTGRPQSRDGLMRIAGLAAERGADLVKIVSPCPRLEDLLALIEATARLAERLPLPFILVGAGENGTLSRTIGMALGSAWALGQQTLTPGGFHPQPLVAHLREIRRLVPWRYHAEAG
ncbi:MAG: type I 3-dehydroquinate dehydratase [Ardenticatenaceae bacterium]|nr:type I 3-dehydroquinate dehydratase [Ardenticatenaceae bacterium]